MSDDATKPVITLYDQNSLVEMIENTGAMLNKHKRDDKEKYDAMVKQLGEDMATQLTTAKGRQEILTKLGVNEERHISSDYRWLTYQSDTQFVAMLGHQDGEGDYTFTQINRMGDGVDPTSAGERVKTTLAGKDYEYFGKAINIHKDDITKESQATPVLGEKESKAVSLELNPEAEAQFTKEVTLASLAIQGRKDQSELAHANTGRWSGAAKTTQIVKGS